MESLVYLLAFILASAVIAFTAFPHLLLNQAKNEKKKVGPVYWGVYKGLPTEDEEEMKSIEIQKSHRKDKTIAGSSMYAKGRGTSFRM